MPKIDLFSTKIVPDNKTTYFATIGFLLFALVLGGGLFIASLAKICSWAETDNVLAYENCVCTKETITLSIVHSEERHQNSLVLNEASTSTDTCTSTYYKGENCWVNMYSDSMIFYPYAFNQTIDGVPGRTVFLMKANGRLYSIPDPTDLGQGCLQETIEPEETNMVSDFRVLTEGILKCQKYSELISVPGGYSSNTTAPQVEDRYIFDYDMQTVFVNNFMYLCDPECFECKPWTAVLSYYFSLYVSIMVTVSTALTTSILIFHICRGRLVNPSELQSLMDNE